MALLNTQPANATSAFVQQNAGAFSSSLASTCQYATNPTKNNLLVVAFSYYPTSITVTSVADTLGNTFQQDKSVTTSGATTNFVGYVYSAQQTHASGTDVITITLSSAPTIVWFTCLEFSGTSDIVRTTSSGSGSVSSGTISASVASFTPTSGDLVYVYAAYQTCGTTGGITYSSSYTAGTAKGTDFSSGTDCKTTTPTGARNQNQADEYSINTALGANTASLSIPSNRVDNSGTRGWLEMVVVYKYQVTQPTTCTTDNSGSAATLSLGGGSVTPTTLACDGSAHNVFAAPSATITATEPGDGASVRYRFSTGTTSTAASTCASGTCSGWSFINYEQLENTYAVSANAQSTFDSGLTAQAVVGTVAGAGGTTVCTISINGGDSTDTQSTCWSDYNSSAVIGSSTIGGAPSNSQWLRSGSCSNTPSSGGNTYTCSYYKQWTNTFQTSANAQTLFDAGMTEAPLGNFAGSPSTQICTITTTASASNSCSGYSDANSAVTFDQLLTGAPSNTRWKNAAGAASSTGSITSGGNTFIVNYYKQLQNTYQASTNGQGPPTWDSGLAMPLSGTLLGSAGTVCTLSPSGSTITAVACTAYADYNAAVSAPSLATGSGSNIQWRLYGTSLYTDTTGGTTHTALLYYKQLQNTYTAAANAQSTFDSGLTFTVTGTLGGTDSQTICTIAPSSSDSTKSCAGYADYNLAVVMPTNPAGAGSDIRWQVSGASSFTDTSGGNSHSTDYYKQWSTTFSATANAQSTFDSGLSTSVTALSLGTSATVCTVSPDGGSASGSCSGYLDNSASASFGTTMSGAGTDTRWACQTCATAAVSSGGSTLTVNYFKQLQETFSVTLNLGDPLAGDTIVILGTFYGTGSSQILSLDVGGASIASSSAWLDYNTTASFPASSTDSGASERWGVSAASATSRITAGGETFSQDYYHQFLQTLSYSIVGGGTPTAPQASGSQFGSGYSPDLSSTPAGYWFDATGSIAFTNPLADSNSTERWQSETSSMSATSSATVALSFYHQNYLTLTSVHGTPNGAGWYDSGSVATFWVTPSTVSGGAGVRYVFAGWSSGDGGYNGTHRFSAHNMTRPVTETAIWRVQYYLSTRASPSWISSRFLVQPEAGWYDAGSKVTLTARSGPFRIAGGDNFYFSSWDVNGTSAGTWKAVVVVVSGRLLVSAHYLVPQSLRYSWSGPSELASDLPGNFQAEYNLTANVDLSSARLHGVLRRASGASAFTITCDGATVWTGSSLPMRRIAVAACGGTLTISRSSMTLTVGPMLSGESHKLSIRFTWSSHTTGRYVIMGSWSGISTNAYGNTRTPATQAFPVRVF